MIDFGSEKVFFNPPTEVSTKIEADTNLIGLKYLNLKDYISDHSEKLPLSCVYCSAFMSSTSKVYGHDEYMTLTPNGVKSQMNIESSIASQANIFNQKYAEIDKNSKVWICEFCGFHNSVDIELKDIPTSNENFYLVEKHKPQTMDEEQTTTSFSNSEGSIIFCIDTSGSMSGTKISCVKKAILNQIEELMKNNPKKKVGVVTFDNYPKVLGDGSKNPEPFDAYGVLNDIELCMEKATKISSEVFNDELSTSYEKIKEAVTKIKVNGSTALGPGLIASIGLCSSEKGGSSIVLCTDGAANLGMGNLSQKDNFYEKAGELAKSLGVVINLITIKGAGCQVDKLCVLTDITGGNISRIKPDKLDGDFEKALENQLIAKNLEVKIILPTYLKFRNEDETLLSNFNSIYKSVIGNTTQTLESNLEYTSKSIEELKALNINYKAVTECPIQLQVSYTSIEGDKVVRVVTKLRQATSIIADSCVNAKLKLLGARTLFIMSKYLEKKDYLTAKIASKKWFDFISIDLMNANKDDEGYEKHFKYFTQKYRKMSKAIDSKLKKEMSKQTEEISKRLSELDISLKENIEKDIEAIQRVESDDEITTKMKKFNRRRSRSFSCSSEESEERKSVSGSPRIKRNSGSNLNSSLSNSSRSRSNSRGTPRRRKAQIKRKTSALRSGSSSPESRGRKSRSPKNQKKIHSRSKSPDSSRSRSRS